MPVHQLNQKQKLQEGIKKAIPVGIALAILYRYSFIKRSLKFLRVRSEVLNSLSL